MESFYMLYVEGGQSPTHKHTTFESAHNEAKRLLDLTGKGVYMMMATRKLTPPKRFEETILKPFPEDDDVPF